jgi:hypothetical protein
MYVWFTFLRKCFGLYFLLKDMETMLGLKKAEAGNDLVSVKKRKNKNKKTASRIPDVEYEEWNGISS